MQLRGITWNHSRGFSSIVAATQRYSELNPNFDVSWEKRSLSEFESKPIQVLAEEFDLLVIDHPWAGFATRNNVLLPLNEWMDVDFLAEQASHSVGASYSSYNFDGFQAALAIDAASPVSLHRPDLISADEVPRTFDETVEFARGGKVLYAATPTYLLMDFYALCNTAGGSLFMPKSNHVVDQETGMEVLEDMRRLACACDPIIFELDPISLHELLGESRTAMFCPFVYGYVNYSRRGYVTHPLKAQNIIYYRGKMLTGVLGGTGLAISASTKHANAACDFAAYVASPKVQSTIFCDSGGQPANRTAWLDEECNRTTLDFFTDTIASLDNAYVRPRYSGYLAFQDEAGPLIYDYVRNGGNALDVLKSLDVAHVHSYNR